MRAVVQRVKSSKVKVGDRFLGKIGVGLNVLVGVGKADSEKDVDYLVDKIVNLRIFSDEVGKMNRSLLDIGAEMLVVPQFTLYGDASKGRRPSFINAADPEKGKRLYELFVDKVRQRDIRVETGEFGAMMEVEIVNDGPVTIIMESK